VDSRAALFNNEVVFGRAITARILGERESGDFGCRTHEVTLWSMTGPLLARFFDAAPAEWPAGGRISPARKVPASSPKGDDRMLPTWPPTHWVGRPYPNRFDVAKSWVYRTIGRIALVLAFLAGIDNRLGGAAACLAVALWVMWSTSDQLTAVLVEMLEALDNDLKAKAEG
jgi:hypothetical protein